MRSFISCLLPVLAACAPGACGGNVVVDTGGGGHSSTTTSTSTSTSASSTSSTSSASSTSSTSSTSSASSSGGATCAPVSGLLAYYPLDADTLDHSGNGNDATGSGLVAVPGKVGQARAFDGSTSWLRATGSTVLAGARTFCAWVDPGARSGLGQPIVSSGQVQKGDFFSLSASQPSGGTCPAAPASSVFVDHWGAPCYTAPALWTPPGLWHLVCYVFDGVGTMSLYCNGGAVIVPGAAYASSLSTISLGSTTIGGTTTQPSLLGALDEVTIWDRALGASDLAALWNSGAGCAAH